ncbi:MAG: TolC family protein [Bacteroidales bacterium]|nr:TolC family protein [Bacteroidales bacterium]
MKKHLILIFCLSAFFLPSFTQNLVLEAYIAEGLQSNQGLKQQQLEYSHDLMALREAKGLFFPEVSLNARYTVAAGGRVIEFPVGDLLNPVYSTLNMLTASQNFPQIENEAFSFYRPTEHETKLSLVQPIISTDLIYNVKIKKDMAEISRIDVERYKRELVLEITRAYYNCQKAWYLMHVTDTTRTLVDENVRVSESLFANDKVTKDVVYRSQADQALVEAEYAKAKNLAETSRAYFNFLLNRELTTEVILVTETPQPPLLSLDEAQETAVQQRPELLQMKQYQQMNQQVTKLYRGKNVPALYGIVDYGFQGEEYSFTGDDDFVLASVVLKWDLFKGMTNHAKVQQSVIEGKKIEEAMNQAEAQIRLDVINSYYGALAGYESFLAARKQQKAAAAAYHLISRKFAAGQSPLLELIDARTSYTQASSSVIIAENDYFIRMAELEHARGSIDNNAFKN